MNIGGGAGAVLGATSGISNLAASLANRLGGSMGSYFDQLRPASFRNHKFVSLSAEGRFGRRNAVHEYPKRDEAWSEDMGRAPRRFRVTGYLVGDDVIQQRDALITAVEQEDQGDLVHPTYGRIQVSVQDFVVNEVWDKGRYFELTFEFIQTGDRLFPSITNASANLIQTAAAALGLSAVADFAARALNAVALGASVVGGVVGTALSWYQTAVNLVGDAKNVVGLVFNLPGSFGRFLGSSTVPTFSSYPSAAATAPQTTDQAIAQATQARTAVSAAASALGRAAATLDSSSASTFGAAAQGVAAAVLASAAQPSDAVRLLSTLAQFAPVAAPATTSVIGQAMATAQSACGDLFRRAALGSLAIATSRYQPTSADDAAALRNTVAALFDAEIEVAGNQGEDATYDSLRSLRALVVQDLNTRGAGLPQIETFTMKGSLPALALAQRLYRDSTRADELVEQANPIHPAFMPLTFRALSS